MKNPYIGETVLFRGKDIPESPAMVTFVSADPRSVWLTIFTPNGIEVGHDVWHESVSTAGTTDGNDHRRWSHLTVTTP